MGAALTRDKHSINDDGTTHWNYPVPTLTLGGTKDGLMRTTRIAEAYYHSVVNVEEAQKDLFPVVSLEGVSHMGFMSGEPPKAVKKRDLVMDVSEEEAHYMAAVPMVAFFDQIFNGKKPSISMKDTKKIMEPILEAMELEAFYGMKDPCYGSDLINPIDDPTCWHGSAWHNEVTQAEMGGDLGKHITIANDDNLHRVQTVTPIHLPEVDSSCEQG